MSRPGTLAWFARHEFRLAWRDWLSMVTAGGRTNMRTVAIAFLVLAAVMHLIAYGMVSRYAGSPSIRTRRRWWSSPPARCCRCR